jgi:arylsulfatase A-like enzyme
MTRWFPTPKRRTLCAGLLCLTSCGGEASRPANLVLVMIDTLRADKVSSYGAEVDTSPGLTRLADKGVQFDSVIAQSSWTLPSVGSMLTSRYPRSLGLYTEDGQMVPGDAVTLAEVVQDAGYATFGFTANPNLNSRYNFHQGFDHYSDSSVVFLMRGDEPPEGSTSYLDAPLRSSPEVFDAALEFARTMNGSRPAFIQLNLMEVHEHKSDRYLREPYKKLFEGQESALYLRAVRQVTDDTEAFVNELAGLPGWEDTLFVILSDHGEGLEDHPDVVRSKGHGALLYGSNISVPWILYNPLWQGSDPGPAGQRVTQTLRLLDVLPTLLDVLQLEAPAECLGSSAWPLALGQIRQVATPEFLVSETFFRGVSKISTLGQGWQYLNNRNKHPGLPRHELQAWDSRPNGVLTDASSTQRKEMRRMRAFLEDWEVRNPLARQTALVGELSEEAAAQLKAIGYLGGDEEGDD